MFITLQREPNLHQRVHDFTQDVWNNVSMDEKVLARNVIVTVLLNLFFIVPLRKIFWHFSPWSSPSCEAFVQSIYVYLSVYCDPLESPKPLWQLMSLHSPGGLMCSQWGFRGGWILSSTLPSIWSWSCNFPSHKTVVGHRGGKREEHHSSHMYVSGQNN